MIKINFFGDEEKLQMVMERELRKYPYKKLFDY